MDTLKQMRLFVRVADSGSFSKAAEELKIAPAITSRAVSELETHLQTRLLQRTTRNVRLTDAGNKYYLRCKEILAALADAENEATGAHDRPSGTIRIHTTPTFGRRYIVPLIAGYRDLYPDVLFNLTLSDSSPNLVEAGFDVSLQTTADLKDSLYVSKRLGNVYSVLCASPSYLATHKPPVTVADLDDHQCLKLTASMYESAIWRLTDGQISEDFLLKVYPPLEVNNVEALNAAVESGLGIAAVPLFCAAPSLRDGKTIRVLPQYTLQDINIYAIYPSRKYIDAKTSTWVSYLQETLPSLLKCDREIVR